MQVQYISYRHGQPQVVDSNNYNDEDYAPCYGLFGCTAKVTTYDGLVLRYEWESNYDTLLNSGALVKTFSWDNYGDAHPDLT